MPQLEQETFICVIRHGERADHKKNPALTGEIENLYDSHLTAKGIEQALNHPISRGRLESAIAPFKENVVLARHFSLLGISG